MAPRWRVEISIKARADFPLPDHVLRDFKIMMQDLEEEGFLEGSESLRGYPNGLKYRLHSDILAAHLLHGGNGRVTLEFGLRTRL